MQNQQEVWNNMAPEWNEFKKPSKKTLEFVEKQKGKIYLNENINKTKIISIILILAGITIITI